MKVWKGRGRKGETKATMFNILSNRGSANENYFVISYCSGQNGYNQEQPLWKSVWRNPQKLKVYLPHNPTIAIPGICPKDSRPIPLMLAQMCSSLLHPQCLGNGSNLNVLQLINDDKTLAYIHIFLLLYLAVRKNENLKTCR